MLALTAFVLIGANANMAALAVKKADTQIDNAKAIVVTTSAGTTIFNINSVKGDKGDPGTNGANGTNGKDGISTICVVTVNQTCGLTPANSTK